jgi:transcriptional regulator with XRE-family HTH domain
MIVFCTLVVSKKVQVSTSLASFMVQARTRRRLTQLELSNISQVNKATISTVERGTHDSITARTAAALGLALHEVQPLSETEIIAFCQLTGVPMHIFADTPQLTQRDRDRRLVQPYVDGLLARYTPESVMFFLQSIETMTRSLIPREDAQADQTFRHVSAPKYRADLGGTEQVITEYARAPKKPAGNSKKKGAS